uniref:Uncharacterized protein n=1 Tax=Arundo donax TaxID=35708 RepID=A0A0A8YS94_ARUDO
MALRDEVHGGELERGTGRCSEAVRRRATASHRRRNGELECGSRAQRRRCDELERGKGGAARRLVAVARVGELGRLSESWRSDGEASVLRRRSAVRAGKLGRRSEAGRDGDGGGDELGCGAHGESP